MPTVIGGHAGQALIKDAGNLFHVGLAKIRVWVDSDSDKLNIWTKTSYPDPVQIINRTLWPNQDPNIRYPDAVVRKSKFVI